MEIVYFNYFENFICRKYPIADLEIQEKNKMFFFCKLIKLNSFIITLRFSINWDIGHIKGNMEPLRNKKAQCKCPFTKQR